MAGGKTLWFREGDTPTKQQANRKKNAGFFAVLL